MILCCRKRNATIPLKQESVMFILVDFFFRQKRFFGIIRRKDLIGFDFAKGICLNLTQIIIMGMSLTRKNNK